MTLSASEDRKAGATRDTIYAPASGHGRAAVATIRISGPASGEGLARLLRGRLPEARRASLRRLVHPATGELLDQALVLWMPGPASFTGEDQAELQIHGGLAVRSAVLQALGALPHHRLAEPGEFTRRAFLNGRLDLTEVEGLADLIDAETEAQRRQALRQMSGDLSGRIASWRERLVDALASCEAALDFSDEDDVPDDVAAGALAAGAEVRREIARALAGAGRGERLREGFQVVIAGPPNAGKSTLLNALARRDVAIVSPVAGTTRDIIEVRCDLGGLPVIFVDTAGLRESRDEIEREGIARARARVESADLVLWLVPPATNTAPFQSSLENTLHPHAEVPAEGWPRSTHNRFASFEASLREAPQDEDGGCSPASSAARLHVATKADLGPVPPGVDLAVSARTGAGLPDLLSRIEEIAGRAMEAGGDAVLTRERHRDVLTRVVDCLDRATLSGQTGAIELLAEDLRLALRQLGRMTGAVDVEEVLDRIFSSFCIGK